jgi:enediyne biosynthesis protein E4
MFSRLFQTYWNLFLKSSIAMTFCGVLFVANGQEPSTSPLYGGTAATPQQGGSATAGIFAPVLDSEKRPITAGGFVKTGPIVFRDISEKAGLTSWHHTMGTAKKRFIIEATGSGVALLDYDNDGWLDIYLVNGSTYEALDGKAEAPHAALFHNNHDGTFTDVTVQAGVTNNRWGYWAAVVDYDNEGWP